MVSRRKILSRSRDELHSLDYFNHEEQDDVWLTKEKLFQDHIAEVMEKWESIDDEIWAKIVVLERNRRVAKAYARAPVITVNGTDDGFDGFRIGVAGFENPMRDAATDEIIRHIGQGFKLKMDDVGNILIKRVTKSAVRVKNATGDESAISGDILKLPGGLLDMDKPFKVFEMKKFQQNMSRELKRPYPDRRRLEPQCISVVTFGSSPDADILNCPIWIICINIVSIEMLRSKMPNVGPRTRPRSMEPRSLMNLSTSTGSGHASSGGGSGGKVFGAGGSSDEDPYSVAGSGSSGSSGNNGGRSRSRDKPPKLPPRDNALYAPSIWAKATDSKKDRDRRGDDPYYCGLRARIPNFVKSKSKKKAASGAGSTQTATTATGSAKESMGKAKPGDVLLAGPLSLPPQIPSHPFWWHSRLYHNDAGQQMSLVSHDHSMASAAMASAAAAARGGNYYRRNPTNFVPYITDSSDSDYSHIYGRLPIPTRSGVRKFPTKPLFMSQWE